MGVGFAGDRRSGHCVRASRPEGRGSRIVIDSGFHVANELREERIRDSLRAYRTRELVALAARDRPSRASTIRRRFALALAALSRRTVAVVRWLDECVAEDLGRQMSPTE